MIMLRLRVFEEYSRIIVHHCNYKTKDEAKVDITKYIELFYNHRRIQKGLDFKTPNQMAEDFYRLAA